MSDDWNSHKPVLHALLKTCNIESVFEFGSGFGSTPIFVEGCKSVHSVEMQSEDWFVKVKEKLSSYENFKYDMMLGPIDAIVYFAGVDKKYDLVFVDGHGLSRPECINAAFSKTDIVVTHDTDVPSYHWERINLPEGWSKINYKVVPWTTVFHKNTVDISELKKELGL
jgi:predicted O-methyltransferase YrrM